MLCVAAVSYTHLDVYKRQVYTQYLSAGENFVDPFKPKEQKDYNPFDAKGKGSEEKK